MNVSLLSRKDTLNTLRDQPSLIFNVTSGSLGLVLAELLRDDSSQTPVIVICPNDDWVSQLEDNLYFFCSQLGLPEPNLSLVERASSPYRRLLPSPQERWQRIRLLSALHHSDSNRVVCLISMQAALRPQISLSLWQKLQFHIKIGQTCTPQSLANTLVRAGYERRELIEDPGTYSVRGGIVDVYPPDQNHPIRIEFFDTVIESIRYFNPDTQRSLAEPRQDFYLVPAREFDCSLEALQASRERIKNYCDEQEIPKTKRDHLSELMARGVAPLELDHLLLFLQENGSAMWEHAPQKSRWVIVEPQLCKDVEAQTRKIFAEEYKRCQVNLEIVPPTEGILVPPTSFEHGLAQHPQVWLAQVDSFPHIAAEFKQNAQVEPILLPGQGQKNWDLLAEKLKEWLELGFQISFAANSETQLDRFGFFLHQRKLAFSRDKTEPQKIGLFIGNLSQSILLPQARSIYLSEDDVFGQKVHGRHKSKKAHESYRVEVPQLKSLDHLMPDDLVVHLEHGIGRYKGLVTLRSSGVSGDFVVIEYADKDKLYLPIYRLDLLQKYIGTGGNLPAPDRLGTQNFQRAKDRVKESVRDIAADLLRLYAQRSTLRGYAFSEPNETYHNFAASFPYDETPDQEKAIKQTINDMCSPRPMDRLVCGDVGFGKTEVALRAAMKAVLDHKQVAVLVPTTILAEQHFQTFSQRFKDFPIHVASLSRFRSPKEQKKILAELKERKVDIVIGTHRLLSKDVAFADLGLIIIDEEQRFGVEHKERLKQFKLNTDVLTLTATPIPRTLHMSLMGLRDISLIQTAPADRLPIRTHISPYDPEVIKNAVETELQRGGQIFFLHNRVQSIEAVAQALRELMPKLRIGVAHGQMSESKLEKVMLEFYHHDHDLLLSTAIIENGLDVPNANTIIINRADTFGLSQLYQLRGRVGRSRARAFAYLLVPESGRVTDEARERLHLLQRFAELGSGYAIASHDLEMRGGGDLLGAAQSGHVALVGYDLYLELLQEEVSRLKGESKQSVLDVEINAAFPAFIPELYVSDMRSRLSLYKRLSEYGDEEQLLDARRELQDRYGALPHEAEELFALLKLKLLLRRVGMRSIQINSKGLTLSAGPDPKISHEALLARVNKEPDLYSFTSEGKLVLRLPIKTIAESINVLRNHLPGLSS